jgi:hypothetical protein
VKSRAPARCAAALLAAFPLAACCQNPHQVEIQRALIQRDQQSAEFARGGLEALHSNQLRDAGRPLSADPAVARELLPYERQQMAREREMFPPLDGRKPAPPPTVYPPLPLPGGEGPPSTVIPISTPSVGG